MPLQVGHRFAQKKGQGKHRPPPFSPIWYLIIANLPPWLQVFFTRNGPNADQLLACVCNQGYTHTINPKLLSAVMRVLGCGPLSMGHLVTLTTSAALCAKNTSLIPITDEMRREMDEDFQVSKKESGSARRGGREGWRLMRTYGGLNEQLVISYSARFPKFLIRVTSKNIIPTTTARA